MDKMRILLFTFISSAIRQGALLAAPFLLEKFHFDLNSPTAGVYLAFAGTFVATYLWSVIEKSAFVKQHEEELKAALSLPIGATVEDVKERAAENKLIDKGNI